MNILTYKIRGSGDLNKNRQVKEILRGYNINFLSIQET